MAQRSSFHHLLSRGDAKLRLAGLGIFVGVFAGLIVTLFRFILESGLPFFADGLSAENFEALSPWLRFFLPVAGCLLIAIIFHYFRAPSGAMGAGYVIDKVRSFRGHMPVRNAVFQFIGATLALLSGGSCGREGPAIHLGASSGSMLGYWLNLPNNSIRTLIACGSAAAISASFNTPIAGVIFAMEVIMMEYAISSFIPVIIASVSGAVVTQIYFGNDPVFDIASTSMNSLWEIPYVALIGILLGALASLFVRLYKAMANFKHVDQRIRLAVIGLLTGSVAIFIPEVMGMGYDTLNQALQGNLVLTFLIVLLLAKTSVTAIGLGLGLPGGVIGPTIMIGGIAGAVMGIAGSGFADGDPAFYVLLGMCAMMGATLQAPLAALMALLELSNNPNIILPAMITIVAANLTFSEVLKSTSIFLGQHDEIKSPGKELSRILNRYGVSSIVKSDFAVVNPDIELMALDQIMQQNPQWLILEQSEGNRSLIRKSDLELEQGDLFQRLGNKAIHHPLLAISQRATLQEALELLQEAELKYAYLYRGIADKPFITGVISIDDIISFYRD